MLYKIKKGFFLVVKIVYCVVRCWNMILRILLHSFFLFIGPMMSSYRDCSILERVRRFLMWGHVILLLIGILLSWKLITDHLAFCFWGPPAIWLLLMFLVSIVICIKTPWKFGLYKKADISLGQGDKELGGLFHFLDIETTKEVRGIYLRQTIEGFIRVEEKGKYEFLVMTNGASVDLYAHGKDFSFFVKNIFSESDFQADLYTCFLKPGYHELKIENVIGLSRNPDNPLFCVKWYKWTGVRPSWRKNASMDSFPGTILEIYDYKEEWGDK